ncbi:MAG: hypothetical protein Q8934_18120 [Bacillota bacterium]|nr:hypothetical protein [Bacillota bacterium]
MNEKGSYEELIKEIQALPKPNYEKDFNNDVQHKIHQNLLRYQENYQRSRWIRYGTNKLGVVFSSIAVLLLIFVLSFKMIPHNKWTTSDHNTLISNGTKKPKQEIKNELYNYKQYLPFTPLLPSNTVGHKLTYSEITRNLDPSQGGNSIWYTARYGTSFGLIEGQANQYNLIIHSGSKMPLTIGKNIQATMYTHDEGETIEFIKNNLIYQVTSNNHHLSLEQLKKVCESISVPATQTPTVIHLSDNGPQSVNELSFKPILAGQFYVPSGFKLDIQVSAINIEKGSKEENYQITYKNARNSYLTIIQTIPNSNDYAQNVNYHMEKMNGVAVYITKIPQLPTVQFSKPKTNTQITIDTNVSETELKKVINSLINE